MRKQLSSILIISFFIFCYQGVLAQNAILDSLKQSLILSTEMDTSKLILLREIGDEYYEINFDSTLHYYNSSLDLSRQLPHYNIEISTLRSLGFLYSFRKNNYDKSLEYFRQAKSVAVENKDSTGMAYACSDIGRIFWKQGKSAKALEQHLDVRRIGEALKSDRILLRANLSLGIIHNEEGDNEKAIEFYNDGLVQADSLGHLAGRGLLLNNMGTAYQDDGNYKLALEKFEAAEEIFSKIKNSGRLALVNSNLAENAVFQNQLEKAISYFKEALDYNEKIDDKEQRAMIYSGVASALFKMKEYYPAIDFAKKGITTLEDVKTDLYYSSLYETLAESYDAVGNKPKSVQAYKALLAAKDQLNKKEQSKEIKKILTLYENQKKETEIQKLNLEKEKSGRKLERSQFFIELLIAGIIILIIFGVLLLTYIRFREIKRVDDMKTNLAKDLHDNIGSSLNHIKILSNRLARGNNGKETQQDHAVRIKKLSNEVMYDMYDMLWTIDKDKGTIADLVQHMRDHLNNTIQSSGSSIKTEFDNLKNEEPLKMTVKSNLFSIFKEAIHNISKHTDSSRVFVSLKNITGNRYELIIKNEFEEKINEQEFSSKRGLANMKERAKKIHGKLKIEEKLNSFLLKLEWKN